jgi:hypothetical protein
VAREGAGASPGQRSVDLRNAPEEGEPGHPRNAAEVTTVNRPQLEPGLPAQYIELPQSRYACFQADKILYKGRYAGMSTDVGYERACISIASIDAALAAPGTGVTVLWGEQPDSRKPGAEPHRQARDPRDRGAGALRAARPVAATPARGRRARPGRSSCVGAAVRSASAAAQGLAAGGPAHLSAVPGPRTPAPCGRGPSPSRPQRSGPPRGAARWR